MKAKWIFFAPFILLALSCELETKDSGDNNSDQPERNRLNQEIKPIKKLNDEQAQITSRVCRNLRAQRIRLNGLPNGKAQSFRIEEKTCPNGRMIRNTVKARLNFSRSGPYWSIGQNLNLIEEILTDRSSVFNQVCDDLDAGLDVDNTIFISSRYVHFSINAFDSDKLDTVELTTYGMRNGAWRAERIESYDILWGQENPELKGMTSAQRHRYFCLVGRGTGEVWQKTL